MAQSFFKFGQHVINWVFGLLFGLTLLFAITSPNLIVGDNSITGAGTTIVTAILLIMAVVVCVSLYASIRFRTFCQWLFVQHARWTATGLVIVVVIWQIVFVTALHPPIGWDAGALHQALTDTTSANMRGYYSSNFNNVPVLLVMHWFALVFHSTSWLTFDYITLAFVDLSALFNITALWILGKRYVSVGLYVHAVWLAVFPTIIVPYTDAWVLPLVSLILLSYVVLMRGPGQWYWRLPMILPLVIATVAAYFIKPSSIVPVIAIVVVEFLFAFKKETKVRWRQLIVTFVSLVVVAGGSYQTMSKAIHQQTYIQIIAGREIPAVHFISMGVSGEGGYNAKDALMMAVLPTKQARADYSVKLLKKRLKKMGAWGYAKFLLMKHRNNTADGSFAWDKEGSFINENPKPTPGPGLKNHLQQFVYLYGTNLGDFRWLSQLVWVIGLLLIAFAWEDQRRMTQILRVTIVGAFLYLLIFEGGRSRYIIQYLPAFIMLITLVADRSIKRWRRLFSWGKNVEN